MVETHDKGDALVLIPHNIIIVRQGGGKKNQIAIGAGVEKTIKSGLWSPWRRCFGQR